MTLLVVAGCGGEPTATGGDFTTLFFSTLARDDVGPDQSLMTCTLVGQLQVTRPRASETNATVDIDYERSFALGGGPVVRLTRFTQGVTLSDLGGGTVRVVLDGAYVDTLRGQRAPDGTYRGDWVCGGSFPFAADTLLVAAGFDTTTTIAGSWILQEPTN